MGSQLPAGAAVPPTGRRLAIPGRRWNPPAAVRIAGPPGAPVSFVLVHGFSNWSRSRELHQVANELSGWAHVVAFDLRGHGRSGGRSTLGVKEPWDVAAAVTAALAFAPDTPVVALGISLGGVSALMAAGRGSPVARCGLGLGARMEGLQQPRRCAGWPHGARPVAGRALLVALSGTRVDVGAAEPERVAEAMAAIAPRFVVIAHDPQEPVFGPEHAETLFSWAREPKALWWTPGGGHGRSMLTPELIERIRIGISARLRPAGTAHRVALTISVVAATRARRRSVSSGTRSARCATTARARAIPSSWWTRSAQRTVT